MTKIKEVKTPKDLLRETYKEHAETFYNAYIENVCTMLAENLTGKEMLEVQNILKDSVNLVPLMEKLSQFVIDDAKLTDDEIMIVINYTSSDVGKRAIKAGINSAKYLQENQEEIVKLIIGTEAIQKLNKIIEKK